MSEPARLLSRRTAVAVAGLAAAGAALPACTVYGSSGPAPAAGPTAAAPAQDGTAPAGAAAAEPPLARTADIPVGGGKIFTDRRIVVTQPTAGTFAGFDTTCTHQGCTVAEVAGGTINCPCHGSTFNIADGSVANGPATKPLPRRDVTVEADEIRPA
jgi:Rieske Fe-S protein